MAVDRAARVVRRDDLQVHETALAPSPGPPVEERRARLALLQQEQAGVLERLAAEGIASVRYDKRGIAASVCPFALSAHVAPASPEVSAPSMP